MGTEISKQEKDYYWVWEDEDSDSFIARLAHRKLQQTIMLDKVNNIFV